MKIPFFIRLREGGAALHGDKFPCKPVVDIEARMLEESGRELGVWNP